jgi:uncharacterized protein YjeT (DUF2065 family)
MDWTDLFAALALVLIIEGIMPFANPAGLRRACTLIAQLENRHLRIAGFASMSIGVIILYFVRQ